jgi:hypothetical protein
VSNSRVARSPQRALPPQVICTFYKLIYTKDKSAIDALGPLRRRKAKQRFDALSQLKQLLFQMASRPWRTCTRALAILVEEVGEAAAPAVCDAVATLDARRAPAAASPMDASLEDAAGAAPVRAVPPMSLRVAAVASTAAPRYATRGVAARAAAAVSAELAPAVAPPAQSDDEMPDAPSLAAAPVVEQAGEEQVRARASLRSLPRSLVDVVAGRPRVRRRRRAAPRRRRPARRAARLRARRGRGGAVRGRRRL